MGHWERSNEKLEFLFSCNFSVFIAFHSSISTKKHFWSWLVPDEIAKYYYCDFFFLKEVYEDGFLFYCFLIEI